MMGVQDTSEQRSAGTCTCGWQLTSISAAGDSVARTDLRWFLADRVAVVTKNEGNAAFFSSRADVLCGFCFVVLLAVPVVRAVHASLATIT